jgi:hypothetical protein
MDHLVEAQLDIELDETFEAPRLAGRQAGPEEHRLVFSVRERNAFFARVTEHLRKTLPNELSGYTARPMFNLMKVAYQNEKVHYEIAIDNSRRSLEIALHFEDGPVSTAAYLAFFDRHIVELKDLLGQEIELERWTVSWGRIYELWPLTTLGRPVVDQAAARLADYIKILQPRLDAAAVRAERSAQPAQPRRFSR